MGHTVFTICASWICCALIPPAMPPPMAPRGIALLPPVPGKFIVARGVGDEMEERDDADADNFLGGTLAQNALERAWVGASGSGRAWVESSDAGLMVIADSDLTSTGNSTGNRASTECS